MRTVAEVIRWRARRHPDLAVTWFEGRSRTFGEMDTSSSELAAGLVGRRALQPGDRVAILDKNSDAYVERLCALDKSGAVAVPVNWRLTAAEVAQVVGDAEPAALVVGDELRASAGQVACRVLGFGELPREAGGQDPGRDREEAVSWQLYTSGTTGLPKGAMLTNRNLLGNSAALLFELLRTPGAPPLVLLMTRRPLEGRPDPAASPCLVEMRAVRHGRDALRERTRDPPPAAAGNRQGGEQCRNDQDQS